MLVFLVPRVLSLYRYVCVSGCSRSNCLCNPRVCVFCACVYLWFILTDFLKRKEGKPRAHQGGLPRATRGQFVVFFFFLLL